MVRNIKINGPGLLTIVKSLHKQPYIFLNEWMKKYGDIIHLKLFKEIYVINSSDFSREILKKVHKEVDKDNFITQRMSKIFGNGIIVSEGEQWLNERRMLQPAFHKNKINYYYSDIAGISDEMIQSWKKQVKGGKKKINITADINQLLLKIISKTLFEFHSDQFTLSFIEMMEQAAKIISSSLPFNLPKWIPGTSLKKINILNNDIEALILKLLEKHKTDIEDGEAGILSIMHKAQDENGAPLNRSLVIDEIKSILLAGIFTTSDAILWTFFLLEKNQSYKEAVLAELKNWHTSGADITKLHHLSLLKNCINESLRLYPPVWSMWYHAKQTLFINDCTFPKNSVLFINLYNIHRNPKHFKDPENFKPERFEEESFHEHAFIPYGNGPRKCIGANLASAIIPMVMAKILISFDTKLENLNEIRPKVRVTLTQNKPLMMRLRSINNDDTLR